MQEESLAVQQLGMMQQEEISGVEMQRTTTKQPGTDDLLLQTWAADSPSGVCHKSYQQPLHLKILLFPLGYDDSCEFWMHHSNIITDEANNTLE